CPLVFWFPNSAPSAPSVVKGFLTPFPTHSSELFVDAKKLNSFAIKQIQTLAAKYRGGGVCRKLCANSAISASQRYPFLAFSVGQSNNRSAQSCKISRSQIGRFGLRGCGKSVGIRPVKCRNTAAECLYAGTGSRNATFPRYCRASDNA